MSGTSCDGVDAALVHLGGNGPELKVDLLDFETTPYEPDLRQRLLKPAWCAREVCLLDFELGDVLGRAARRMMDRARGMNKRVDFVASHGHTLVHLPPRESEGRGSGTLQIGQSAVIAERTGLPVVSDFRPRDMAAGGQGAPLVPYADWLLFRKADAVTACLNIGGIANITVVTPALSDVFAFDAGPGNMILDGAMRQLTSGKRFLDEDGQEAAKGRVIEPLLARLLDHPYFESAPPKSAGREQFGLEEYLVERISPFGDAPIQDVLATATRAVAAGVTSALERFISPRQTVSSMVVSGGGARNPILMRFLQEALPGIRVTRSDELGYPGDAREALAFAILGNETICGRPANVPAATGASRPVILGRITF